MKRFCGFLAALLLTVPVWADDALNPDPLDKETKQYKGFWKSNDIDPMNHEVWKLYIFSCLVGQNNTTGGGTNAPTLVMSSLATKFLLVDKSDISRSSGDVLLASLTPDKKNFVLLQTNNLYNFFQTIPKPGDVIVVEGRVLQHSRSEIDSRDKTFNLNTLLFYAEDGQKAVSEHFDPSNINSDPVTAVDSASPATVIATPGFFKANPGTPTH